MAFFDKLSKTVSEASQKTLAKAKELADTTKLNSAISEEEKKITSNYYQIGKLYVSLYKDNRDENFGGMLAAIVESEEKIKAYKRQIQEIKGVQRCEKCGAEVANGAAFCNACGAAMPRVSSPASNSDCVICESCGKPTPKGMRFCTICGKPLAVAPVAAPEPAPAPSFSPEPASSPEASSVFAPPSAFAPEAQVEAPAPQQKVCPSCGTPILDNEAIFCVECGTKLM